MKNTEPSIFTRIINREIPAQFIYEDEWCVAILDKFPGIPGQSLIIPKQQVAYAFDLEDAIYQHIFLVAKKIAQASDRVFATERTCLVVEGFEVPHVHIKLYPMTRVEPNLSQILVSTASAADDDLQKIAERLRAALA